MTIDQARLVIYNPDAYDPQDVASAVLTILSSFEATAEDIDTACYLA